MRQTIDTAEKNHNI